MKKIFLIVGLAFACSSVYAQVVIQTGFNNTFTPINSGSTNTLTSYKVEQYNGNNTAIVNQGPDINVIGQENFTTVFQKNVGATSPSMGNFMKTMQSGGTNRINGRQLGMNQYADLTQAVGTASSNITTSQSGEKNLIVAAQNSGSFNKATITQGAAFADAAAFLATTIRNTTRLQQSGQRGQATITQTGSAGLFIGVQKGGGLFTNFINVTQSNNGGFDADQDGDNNNINSTQEGNQYATAMQGTTTINGEITINQGSAVTDDTRNTAYVKQTAGNSNVATVTQTAISAEQNLARINQAGTRRGVAEKSKATVIQSGKSGLAEIDQLAGGTFNQATVTQTLSQIKKGNFTGVSQSGEANILKVDQNGNSNVVGLLPVPISIAGAKAVQSGQNSFVTLRQDGQANAIGLTQEGASNTINVTQFNDLASGIGNKATAVQKAATANGVITINQNVAVTTDENVATVYQNKGNKNTATVTQDKKNMAMVTQEGTDDGGVGSTVVIDQSQATSGQATVNQLDGTQGGVVVIQQKKIGNIATADQNAGRQNLAQIIQTDDGNNAKVIQTGTIDVTTLATSKVYITQNGKKGKATVTQGADGSTVQVQQTNGNENEATVDQLTGRVNDTSTRQFGDKSRTTVTQTGQQNVVRTLQTNILDALNPSNGQADHTATVIQSGTLNQAAVGQAGLTNIAKVTQAGQENFATSAQYGTKNTVTTTQTTTGRNNNAYAIQFAFPGAFPGAYNAALVTRKANNVDVAFAALTAADIQQVQNNEATLEQTGNGENQVIAVVQTGDTEKAFVLQPGSDNQALVVQAGKNDYLKSTQSGTLGNLDARQFGAPNQIGNKLEYTDTGTQNQTRVAQIKYDNQAIINQKGSDNGVSGAVLGTAFFQIGIGNRATINQIGKKGSILGIQGDVVGVNTNGFTFASTGATAANDALRNTVTIDQDGSGVIGNVIAFEQQGDDGEATIDQKGNDNTAGIRQLNGATLRSTFNKAKIVQGAGVANSFINIVQTGRTNKALDVSQTGNGTNNDIGLIQTNDQNEAILLQDTGNNNYMRVNQNTTNPGTKGGYAKITQTGGSNNEARLRQDGYENSLTLTQTGNTNLLRNVSEVPGSTATQVGHNNTATLKQTGDGHIINLGQGGMGNMTTITQASL